MTTLRALWRRRVCILAPTSAVGAADVFLQQSHSPSLHLMLRGKPQCLQEWLQREVAAMFKSVEFEVYWGRELHGEFSFSPAGGAVRQRSHCVFYQPRIQFL